jgi:hypothetical protein
MSMLLFIVGGIAVMLGAATVAFGIPINEFSFGNTLIVAGTTLGASGLIVIAIAAAVRQLNRIAERLEQGAGFTVAQPERFEAPAAGRIPLPPKTKPVEPSPVEGEMPPPPAPPPPMPAEAEAAGAEPAPGLRNPEAPPTMAEEEVSLSPPIEPPPRASEPGIQPPSFEAMWPAKPSPPPVPPEPPAQSEPEAQEPASEEPPLAPQPSGEPQPQAVAVLKSGVVDGMGYTLYVDGSIEAELPQGTVRFASIDELRAHLEKSS